MLSNLRIFLCFAFSSHMFFACGKEHKNDAKDPHNNIANDAIESKYNSEISALNLDFHPPEVKNLPLVPLRVPELVGHSTGQWTRPHLPPLRFNSDARLGVQMKSSDPNSLDMLLLAPERLKTNFHESKGAEILQTNSSGTVHVYHHDYDSTLNAVAPGWKSVHSSFCDNPTIQNPSVCTDPLSGKPADCYKLYALVSARKDSLWRIISVPINVRVSNPKSSNAKISDVRVQGSITMSTPSALTAIFEPLAVGDGRLFIGRVGKSSFDWTDSSGKTGSGRYDVIYSWYPSRDKDGKELAACDASRWSNLLPISHAPYDADVKAKYDFAKEFFRDGAGNILPDGLELGITYPWMDHLAKNLAFVTSISPLFSYNSTTKKVGSRFDVKCTHISCTDAVPKKPDEMAALESTGGSQGFAIMGAWTRGKMTLLDNLLNKSDFGLGGDDKELRDVALYRSNATNVSWVTVGANRDTKSIAALPGYVSNTTLFDSIGDRFAHHKNFRTALPKDVVWLVSNGTMTDEVSFDDFLDLDVVLSADMSSTLTWNPISLSLEYNDGVTTSTALVQNTAFISNQSPPYGRLTGKARLEPVAAGGRMGRGVFLDAGDSIQFDFPRDIETNASFFSIFLNSRMQEHSQSGEIARFPDGSRILISALGVLTFEFKLSSGQVATKTVGLPIDTLTWDKWVHLGFLLESGASPASEVQLSVFLDGMKYRQIEMKNRPFKMTQGMLTVGQGFRGWIDEVRFVKSAPNLEEACNLAYGTLGAISPAAESDPLLRHWMLLAANYPDSSHQEIKSLLQSLHSDKASSRKYVCMSDQRLRLGWSPRLPKPNGISYLRQTIHMEGKKFVHNQPRPDATTNSFCLSCHSNSNLVPGLKTTSALKMVQGRIMSQDRRKQPTQPVPKIYGYTPAGLFDGSPESSNGIDVYKYLFP